MTDDWESGDDPWTITAMRRVYDTNWFAVDDHDVINPAGRPGFYGVIRIRRLAVGVLPIDDSGRVHLVGQWRFPLKRYSWEMPEGGAEPGEDPRDCAMRELKEETGLSAARLDEILRMDLSNSLTDEQAILYLASGLIQGEAQPEDTEVLAHRTAPFLEVVEKIASGRITDALTVAAVLRAHHMAVTGRLPDALARAMLSPG